MPVLDELHDLVKFMRHMYNLQTRIQFITNISICVKQLSNKWIHHLKYVNLIWILRNCSRNYRLCPVLTRLLGFHLTAPPVFLRIATIQSK